MSDSPWAPGACAERDAHLQLSLELAQHITKYRFQNVDVIDILCKLLASLVYSQTKDDEHLPAIKHFTMELLRRYLNDPEHERVRAILRGADAQAHRDRV